MMKNISLQYIRVLAMFLVIFYHCIAPFAHVWDVDGIEKQPIWDSWGSVLGWIHIPFFMVISGYLFGMLWEKYRSHGFVSFVKRKGKRLMLPYLFWSVVVVVYSHSEWTELFRGLMHLWFLITLFEIMLLAYFGNWLCSRCGKKMGFLLCVLVIVLFWLAELFPCSFLWNFRLNSVLHYMPFFVLGIIWKPKDFFPSKAIKYMGGVLVIICMVSMEILHYQKVIPEVTYKVGEFHFALLLCAVVLACCSKGATRKLLLDNVIEWLAERSIGIYLLQQFVILVLLKVDTICVFANSHYICFPFLCFFVTLGICCFVTSLTKRLNLKYLI